jgi:hypothetical protein
MTGQRLLGIPIIVQITEAEKNRQARIDAAAAYITQSSRISNLLVKSDRRKKHRFIGCILETSISILQKMILKPFSHRSEKSNKFSFRKSTTQVAVVVMDLFSKNLLSI